MAKFGEIFPENIGFIVANQDQNIISNNYKKYISKGSNISNDTFVNCPEKAKTIQGIAVCCLALNPNDYTIFLIK
jgi:hypothetical protein